jgi:hypothetical protein
MARIQNMPAVVSAHLAAPVTSARNRPLQTIAGRFNDH